ncbi:RlpA-like double-psi beta-barrel-protein domain-containing protein-containing protein [Russula aff. rugulosa BPL654]|nr:RlpA-like double-psi beta-barrel-protein domain-containing protein-containing protein [Russula aff. rugulosa BPL654]
MYKLALILFSFSSLVFPILAVPMPAPIEINGLAQRNINSFSGTATRYTSGPGACGNTNSADQPVVAIPTGIFSNRAHCNQQVTITYAGKSVQATVVDECQHCGAQDIEISPVAFQQLTGQNGGVANVTWGFN